MNKPVRIETRTQIGAEMALLTLEAELLGITPPDASNYRHDVWVRSRERYRRMHAADVVLDDGLAATVALAAYSEKIWSMLHGLAILLDSRHVDLALMIRRSLYEHSIRGRYYAAFPEAAALAFKQAPREWAKTQDTGFTWAVKRHYEDIADQLEDQWDLSKSQLPSLSFRDMAREVLRDRYRYEIGLHYGFTSGIIHGSLMPVVASLGGIDEIYAKPGAGVEYYLGVSLALQFVASVAPEYRCLRAMGQAELAAKCALKELSLELPTIDKAARYQMFPGIVAFPSREQVRQRLETSTVSRFTFVEPD